MNQFEPKYAALGAPLQNMGPTEVDGPNEWDEGFMGPHYIEPMPKATDDLSTAMKEPGMMQGAAQVAEENPGILEGGEGNDSGLGFMGWLGVGNMVAGIGSQIFKAVTKSKPRRPMRGASSSGGGNPFGR